MAAVAVTVMTVGATALVTDQAWLVDQRDVLKTASDAVAVATTLELSRQLDLQPGISDADLAAILEPIAERYILLNLTHMGADRYAHAEQSLVVQVTPNRIQRTVDVSAEAELGGTFMSRLLPLMADSSVAERIRAESIVETFINPVEVVLAIDISDSMKKAVDSDSVPRRGTESETPTRMAVVKMAAANLVAVLVPDDENRIAIGVVPCANVVRLDEQTRDRWERNGWARYPTRRVYGVPYRCKPNRTCPDPPPVTQDVAASPPEAWLGCLDEHRMGSLGTLASLPAAAELLWPPARSAFAQNYFAAHYSYAYECTATPPPDMQYQLCYGPPANSKTWGKVTSQQPCDRASWDPPSPIQPLSTDRAVIEQAIGALEPVGSGTYSTLGVLWAQRLLQHSWKDVWEGTRHPVDPEDPDNAGLRKAIVLLTDGDDNYCGLQDPACDNRDVGIPSQDACDVAKESGSEIFVIAAMAPAYVPQELADRLRACSSQSDNPDGTYVFMDNATPEALLSAFAEIANQLRTVRRVY